MNQRQLSSFVCCAESKSFSKAAKKLYISTNSLIQQINLLEQEIGVTLFFRSSRGIKLTESGMISYNGAKSILEQWDQIILESKNAALNNHPTFFRIGIPKIGKTLFLEKVCSEFLRTHNNIRYIFLSQTEHHPSEDVLQEKIDFTLLPYSTKLECDELEYRFLFESSICGVLNPSHPLACKKSILIRDLIDYDIVLENDDWFLAFPFLHNHNKQITTVENLPYVYSSCFNGSVYLLPDIYATQFPQFLSRPIADIPKVQINVVCRRNMPPEFMEYFSLFIETAQTIQRKMLRKNRKSNPPGGGIQTPVF